MESCITAVTQTESIEWTEKNIDDKIARYLQHHLMSKKVNPSDVLSVQVAVGDDQGNTAFQFGASVSVKLCDRNIIEFEVSVCNLICRKDTAAKAYRRTLGHGNIPPPHAQPLWLSG